MKSFLHSLLMLLLVGAARADDDLALAREAFRKSIAAAYGVAEKKVTVHPMHPGQPDKP